MCQCEHVSHDMPRQEGSHEYMAHRPAGVTVATPYGRFSVCRECADTCYKDYRVVAGIQK